MQPSKDLLRIPLSLLAVCLQGIYLETGEMGNNGGSSSELPFCIRLFGADALNRILFWAPGYSFL